MGRHKTSVKLTMIHRRRLALVLIISLIACALMPVSAALFSGGQSACHSLSDSHSSIDGSEMGVVLNSSPHHSVATEHEPLCNEDPVPLPAELAPLHIGWWTTVLLLVVLPARQFAMHAVWRNGPRRYPPALRTHLAIGRIQV